jgi:cytidine deaminase
MSGAIVLNGIITHIIMVDGVITGFTTPCGVCRQVMKEFCNDDFLVYVIGPEDGYETYTLAQLLPSGFSL